MSKASSSRRRAAAALFNLYAARSDRAAIASRVTDSAVARVDHCRDLNAARFQARACGQQAAVIRRKRRRDGRLLRRSGAHRPARPPPTSRRAGRCRRTQSAAPRPPCTAGRARATMRQSRSTGSRGSGVATCFCTRSTAPNTMSSYQPTLWCAPADGTLGMALQFAEHPRERLARRARRRCVALSHSSEPPSSRPSSTTIDIGARPRSRSKRAASPAGPPPTTSKIAMRPDLLVASGSVVIAAAAEARRRGGSPAHTASPIDAPAT